MKTLPNASESVRRLNPEIYSAPDCYLGPDPYAVPPRLRQNRKPLMNKLEKEFFDVLRATLPSRTIIRPQAKRYQLGNGIWYKPDFTAILEDLMNGERNETAWEVKGPRVWRGGYENLKVAARQWPEVKFIMVWKDANGKWNQQRILA